MNCRRLAAWVATAALLGGCHAGSRTPRTAVGSPQVPPGLYQVADLTGPELASLPRERTLFLLPVGMMEEHGPHLPAGSDNFSLASEVSLVQAGLKARLPDWYLMTLPTVPYGADGANGLSGDPVHPGTYALRASTLKAVVHDLGEEVGRNGFRWTFVLYTHGAPDHAKAITQACDDVSDDLDVTMANLTATTWADPERVKEVEALTQSTFTAEERKGLEGDIHAGAVETSLMLAAAPERVRPIYKTLAPQTSDGFVQLMKVARRPGWPGYFGSPALARVEFGQKKQAINVDTDLRLILDAVHGDTLRKRPRAR